MLEGKKGVEEVFMALSEQLGALGSGLIEMVVCGGAALNILGYVRRTTEDVDVIEFKVNLIISAKQMYYQFFTIGTGFHSVHKAIR